jgi:hypothetical protein
MAVRPGDGGGGAGLVWGRVMGGGGPRRPDEGGGGIRRRAEAGQRRDGRHRYAGRRGPRVAPRWAEGAQADRVMSGGGPAWGGPVLAQGRW